MSSQEPSTPGIASPYAHISIPTQSSSSPCARPTSLDLGIVKAGHESWVELDFYPYLGTNTTYASGKDTQPLIDKSTTSPTLSSRPRSRSKGTWEVVRRQFKDSYTSLEGSRLVQAPKRPFKSLDKLTALFNLSNRYSGWRMGVLCGSCFSALILGFNITVLIWAATKGSGFKNGFAEPFDYDPRSMSRLSSIIHIVINILSTILLSASNYTMQVLSSPTRLEIDKEHQKGRWFYVGVLSLHNLKKLPWKRVTLCAILVLSSVPLHLFYNSAAIYITATNEFDNFFVPHGSANESLLSTNPNFTRFTNSQWRAEYASITVNYGDLILSIDDYASQINVTNRTGLPTSKSNLPKDYHLPYEAGPIFKDMTFNLTDWINITSFGFLSEDNNSVAVYAHVVEGYGRKVPTKSRVQLSLSFLIVVIVCNAIKLATMVWVLYMEKSDFIVTLGDGAASFLEYRDPTTEKYCVFTKEAIAAEVAHRRLKQESLQNSGFWNDTSYPRAHDASELDGSAAPKMDHFEELVLNASGVWRDQKHLYSTIGRTREIGPSFIFVVVMFSVIFCIILVTNLAHGALDPAWGTSSDTLFGIGGGSDDTLLIAWIANSPQVVLSFCYFAINSECTAMAGAYEWNNMGSWRKGLRVTKSSGEQRETYFLQLPLRFSLPLMAMSGGLHWLLSQSIFMVQIESYNRQGILQRSGSIFGCGFSAVSFVVLCATFCAFVFVIVIVGRRNMRLKIPFAASCSLAISAACHAPSNEKNPHFEQVKWGVVEERMFDGELHCSFSSEPVLEPQDGVRYR